MCPSRSISKSGSGLLLKKTGVAVSISSDVHTQRFAGMLESDLEGCGYGNCFQGSSVHDQINMLLSFF